MVTRLFNSQSKVFADGETGAEQKHSLRTVSSYALAALLHIGLLVLLSLNLNWSDSRANVAAPVYVEIWDASALQVTLSEKSQLEPDPRQEELAAEHQEALALKRVVEEAAQRKIEAQQKAKLEAQRKAEEEIKHKAELEVQRKIEEAVQRKIEAEQTARLEAQRKAKAEVERKARLEAKRRAKAKHKARLKAKRRAEAKRRSEREQKALRELQEQVRQEQRTRGNIASKAVNLEQKNTVDEQGISEDYEDKVRARVRPNIVYGGSKRGNPSVEIEVRVNANGTILNSAVIKSSINPRWDKAVIQALRKTANLPKDRNGHVPSLMILRFSPEH